MKKNVLLTVVLALFAWAGITAGTGTANDPYTCAEANAVGKDIPVGTHVFGYIVGGRYDNLDLSISGQSYGISIADDASETNVDNCFQIASTAVQEAIWHPALVPSALGQLVVVSGSGNGYGGYPCVENDVTIDAYTAPVTGAPAFADVMPESGSIFFVNEEFIVSATVTTTDASGIDSVRIAYGNDVDALEDTAVMTANVDTYSMSFTIDNEGTKYAKLIAYGANSLMTVSAPIEVIITQYPLIVMGKDNYQTIVDAVNTAGKNTHNYSDNSEDYYGASAYSNNFSITSGNFNAIFSTADDAIEAAIATVLLPATKTDAAVNDTVRVSYATYDSESKVNATADMLFACTSVSPLTFVKVSDTPSSVEDVKAKTSKVFATVGAINIATTGVQSVTVYDFAGRQVASQTINTNATISIAGGVYLVKVGNEVTKVAVQ